MLDDVLKYINPTLDNINLPNFAESSASFSVKFFNFSDCFDKSLECRVVVFSHGLEIISSSQAWRKKKILGGREHHLYHV